jgi:DNA mismatch endonuclease (patch repair protein)
VDRDNRNTNALVSAGWTVVRVWEHESLEESLKRVLEALVP